jgi:lysophospholipase L1-like esterase
LPPKLFYEGNKRKNAFIMFFDYSRGSLRGHTVHHLVTFWSVMLLFWARGVVGEAAPTLESTQIPVAGAQSMETADTRLPTASNAGPRVVSQKISSSSGEADTPLEVEVIVEDANGADDVSNVWIGFNDRLDWSNGLTSVYLNSSKNAVLRSYAGDAWLGPFEVGQVGNDAGGSATLIEREVRNSSLGAGTRLRLKWRLVPSVEMSGRNQLSSRVEDYQGNVDAAGQEFGFVYGPIYTVLPKASNHAPSAKIAVPARDAAGRISGKSAVDKWMAVQVRYSDEDGAADVRQGWLQFNNRFDWRDSACLFFDATTGRLHLRRDDGSDWLDAGLPTLLERESGTITRQGNGVLANSRVEVDLSRTRVWRDEQGVVVSYRLRFLQPTLGLNHVWTRVADSSGTLDSRTTPEMFGFVHAGTWSVATLSSNGHDILSSSNRIVFLGDSQTGPIHGFVNLASATSQGKLWNVKNAGIGGHTSTDMLARLDRDVIAHRPAMCNILAGTNNLGDVELLKKDITEMVDRLQAAQITPILCSLLTDNYSYHAVYRANKAAYHQWLRSFAEERDLLFVDLYSVLLDSATGNFKHGKDHDGLHASLEGQRELAQVWNNAVLPHLKPAQFPLASTSNNSGVYNGQFLLDSDADGVGDGFFLNGGPIATITNSIVTDGEGTKWARAVASNAYPRYNVQQNMFNISDKAQPGDRLAFCGRFRTSGAESGNLMVRFEIGDSVNPPSDFALRHDVNEGVFYTEFTVKENTQLIYLAQVLQSHKESTLSGTVETTNWTLVNLSRSQGPNSWPIQLQPSSSKPIVAPSNNQF